MSTNKMNDSKQLLSYARRGDFAHPGEIKAIQLAMSPIAKNPSQRLLDVGCGLGGTAHYLQQHGWGEVVDVDIDGELMIFDYSRPSVSSLESPFPWSTTASRFNPIYLPEIKDQLLSSNWCFKTSLDVSMEDSVVN